MKNLIFEDLGLINYKKALDYQKKLFEKLLLQKNHENSEVDQYILFCEHPHVFTIGKNGNQANLLIDNEILKLNKIEYYHIDRGGDITYHGPGQMVVYPVLDLDRFGINTREYVYMLEEAVLNTLKKFSITASRLEGAAGIWLDVNDKTKCRKICAIGVKSSRRITMHGLALNINTNLDYFSFINPCGFTDRGVTSMQIELNRFIDLKVVKEAMQELIRKIFQI